MEPKRGPGAREKRKRAVVDYAAFDEGLGTEKPSTLSRWVPTLASVECLPAEAFVERMADGRGFDEAWARRTGLRRPALIADAAGLGLTVPATPFGVGYSATKAAVNGLSRTIAQEHAKDGITANVICPGPVESRMELARQQFDADNAGISLEQKINSATPMGPHGQPEDVSPLAVYLASDDSSFVTGQAWNVDGGILMAT